MSRSEYEVAEIFADLRQQVLDLKKEDIGFTGSDEDLVLAVLMETGYPEAVASLAAVADGSASLYFSNGGGIIGAGEHDAVRETSRAIAHSAQDYVSKAELTDAYPLPNKGNVRFYIVTANGTYSIEALQDDLGYERHSFSPLFHACHALITAIREHAPE